jgi:hypothetical protein
MSIVQETENIDSTPAVQEEKYLKLAATPNKDDKVTVKMRLLDYPGIEVFRHWIGEGDIKFPYTCPGPRAGCPACRERSIAKLAGQDHRQIHRMDHRRVVNILDLNEKDNPKLKVFSISPSIEKSLKFTVDQEPEDDGKNYADPTSYDIRVVKRKTGTEKFDVEYAVQYVAHRELTAIEKALAANKHDLVPETTPASTDVIAAAISGVKPTSQLATPEQRAEVDRVLKAQKLSFIDLKITNPDQLTAKEAQAIVRDLG